MKETIKKKLFEDELLHLPFLKISLYHLFSILIVIDAER